MQEYSSTELTIRAGSIDSVTKPDKKYYQAVIKEQSEHPSHPPYLHLLPAGAARGALPPASYQLSALAEYGWPYPLPATFVEAEDLLRELWADGRHEDTEDDRFSQQGGH